MNWLKFAANLLRESGSPQATAHALLQTAKTTPDLREHLLKLGADQLARNAVTSGRSTATHHIPEPGSPRAPIVLPAQAAREAKARFMDTYRLYGGDILIGDATRNDSADAARLHDAQSKGHSGSATFLREVGKRLPDASKTVRSVWRDDALVDLKDSVLK